MTADTSTSALRARARLTLAERVEAVRATVPTVTDKQADHLAHLMQKDHHEGGLSQSPGLEKK